MADQGGGSVGRPVWDEARAAAWLAGEAAREQTMAAVSDALFARAALQPGERVLDVGVGSGPTTLAAYASVQPGGTATGIDISAAMVAAAQRRPGGEQITWLVGDAGSYDFDAGAFDVVISRLGVMFFADPVAAFANLRQATRPGGRLAAVVWSHRDATGLFGVPHTVATTTLHRLGVAYTAMPADFALFSLGGPGQVEQVLSAAGWSDVSASVDNRVLYMSGPEAAEQAADGMIAMGPVSALLAGQPPDVIAEVRTALVADLEHRRDEVGIGLPAGFIVVSAVRA